METVSRSRIAELLRGSHNVVRSRAPLRISFCGGGTDVAPYPERYGGCVLSCTIDKYAYVSVRPRADDQVLVRSEDTGLSVYFEPRGGSELTGKLDLAQAIIRHLQTVGAECYMHADAPPGSGLGTSSAMIVALIAALSAARGLHLSAYEMAELAYHVERDDLGIAGGYQDQYASAFGGFNFMEFNASGVHVTPLRLSTQALAELHYHLMLCYTGRTRLSANILTEQTSGVTNSVEATLASLGRIKELTYEMQRVLLRGRLRDFGDLLDVAWREKRSLASAISNAAIDELYDAAKTAGALGGKILGAGGGGFFLAFVPFTRRYRVREALEHAGGKVVDFQFEQNGAHSWFASDATWVEG